MTTLQSQFLEEKIFPTLSVWIKRLLPDETPEKPASRWAGIVQRIIELLPKSGAEAADLKTGEFASLLPQISWGNIIHMKSFLALRKRIFGIAAVILVIMLMMNLNNRLSEYFRLSKERDRVAGVVADLALTRSALSTQVGYANSDAAVEDWARNEAHMAKPGDMVIIQMTPVVPTTTPRIALTPTPRPIENWEVWWALFFGE